MLPVTFRHHHKVVIPKSADSTASSVKGNAGLIVNKNPEVPAATARAAVFDVA